jgi:uncharacterized membrane protein YphA (DoxX/SURF4 family)
MSTLAVTASPPRPATGRWTEWIGMLGGIFLGAVLLVAAWSKAIDPAAFAEQIRVDGLAGLLPAHAVALIALALEAGLGLALLLGVRRLWVLAPAALLVALFVFLTSRSYWQAANGTAPAASCGCFGNLVERTPAQAFWQDLLLLVPALLLSFLGRPRSTERLPVPKARTAAALLGAAAAPLLAWKAPALPLDDLATRLHPGITVQELCAGSGEARICLPTAVSGIDQGKNLIVIADLEDAKLTGSIDALNAFVGRPGNPTLWVLTASTPEQQRAFYWRWGPKFNVREVPRELLRPLYRTLPRSFLVENGRVTRTYSGLAPLAAASPSPT